ncbi:hypothetical protein QUC32_29650 (plasmid) [Novosphingobium resinovorum]|uniref:hypothetical protein n=1 Tax=Novosphingobium TaxID=165696 RepID=UPI001B3C63E7|nr:MULTISPECIES: hypothetical protein [Novosphingobium]MBF7015145.1 hypothetical protein [Novosphingobium sp. HR1a]WJM29826.1 hypothetical protein QUC32_29650 [Novosphingobium resinovorum]
MDIIVDLSWFAETKGKLGTPHSRATQPVPEQNMDNTFLLYGDELAIRHLRVLLHTDSHDPPHNVVNANIHRWVNLLEVASGLVASKTATTASLGRNTSGMIIWMGEGDENAESCQLAPEYTPPVPMNYEAAAKLMAAWEPDYRVHLFYLGRFLNHDLPPEVRWLNGYRVLEWHFRRGGVGLAKDQKYLEFIALHGGALDAALGPKQDRKGLIEEVRALAAHAILSRTADPRLEDASTNLISKSFQGLESLVMAVMNEGTGGRVSFMPNISPT